MPPDRCLITAQDGPQPFPTLVNKIDLPGFPLQSFKLLWIILSMFRTSLPSSQLPHGVRACLRWTEFGARAGRPGPRTYAGPGPEDFGTRLFGSCPILSHEAASQLVFRTERMCKASWVSDRHLPGRNGAMLWTKKWRIGAWPFAYCQLSSHFTYEFSV